MKKLLLLFAFALALPAQTLSISLAATSLQPGQSTTVSLTFAPSATAVITTLASNLTGLPLTAFTGWTIGPAAAPKTLFSNIVAPAAQIVTGTALSAGAQTPLGAGVIATATLTVPPATVAGTYQIRVLNTTASNAAGQPVSLALGAAAALTVTGVAPINPLDVNGDGVINQTDVNLAEIQVLGQFANPKLPCTTGDVNKDGVCDARDVQLIVNAIP